MPPSARGPADWSRAARSLADRDPLAARLLERHGAPKGYSRRPPAQRFEALARAIAYQQLSGRAAGTIWSRVVDTVGDSSDPAAFSARTHEELRAAGLSNAKVRSLHDLAAWVGEGRLDLATIARHDDEEVVERLTLVRGIGPWSAQMFLISCLGRTDVWPDGDVGVRNGWSLITGSPEPPQRRELERAGERFRPHRSVVAWWCWREVDTMVPT